VYALRGQIDKLCQFLTSSLLTALEEKACGELAEAKHMQGIATESQSAVFPGDDADGSGQAIGTLLGHGSWHFRVSGLHELVRCEASEECLPGRSIAYFLAKEKEIF